MKIYKEGLNPGIKEEQLDDFNNNQSNKISLRPSRHQSRPQEETSNNNSQRNQSYQKIQNTLRNMSVPNREKQNIHRPKNNIVVISSNDFTSQKLGSGQQVQQFQDFKNNLVSSQKSNQYYGSDMKKKGIELSSALNKTEANINQSFIQSNTSGGVLGNTDLMGSLINQNEFSQTKQRFISQNNHQNITNQSQNYTPYKPSQTVLVKQVKHCNCPCTCQHLDNTTAQTTHMMSIFSGSNKGGTNNTMGAYQNNILRNINNTMSLKIGGILTTSGGQTMTVVMDEPLEGSNLEEMHYLQVNIEKIKKQMLIKIEGKINILKQKQSNKNKSENNSIKKEDDSQSKQQSIDDDPNFDGIIVLPKLQDRDKQDDKDTSKNILKSKKPEEQELNVIIISE